MTDFFKNLYGYDDDIQLKDDDIKTLETGMTLSKLHQVKEEFNSRFYRLDLKNNQLIASTKEFRKTEKLYQLININEVNPGCHSDSLKSYKLKNITDKRKADEMESLAFVISYDNYRKALDLLASSEAERNRWVRVLKYFILLIKKRKGVLPEIDNIMRDYFKISDTNNDKLINKSELTEFLESINLKLKKEDLKLLFEKADLNQDGNLSGEEFKVFLLNLYERREMHSLFNIVISYEVGSDKPEFMTLNQLKKFLKNYQNEDLTDDKCIKLIDEFETDKDLKEKNLLSFPGFVSYLTHPNQFLMDPEKENNVYQDMNFSIFNYFINSSHNTYLSGDQLTSTSSADCYTAAIMNGARLVEMDVYDSVHDGKPKIYHQKTLTSKILFEDAIIACKEAAFKLTEYPLIITIELHCSAEGQREMAKIIKKHLDPYLYHEKFDPNKPYPTINELKRKILLRCQKPKKVTTDSGKNHNKPKIVHLKKSGKSNSFENYEIEDDDEEEDEDDEFETIGELSDLLNIMQNVGFKGTNYAFENYQQNQTSSLGESKAKKLIEKDHACDIIKYTCNYLAKIYPAGHRVASGNIDPVIYWNYGFQIAALNFQSEGTPMYLNKALFNDNGNSGYVLKPKILRTPEYYFDPRDLNTMNNKKIFQIKMISAQNLPQKKEIIKDITDSYVVIQTYGVDSDRREQRTKTIKDNGFNPLWNEDFRFEINCPELAFIKFKVMDDDPGKDDLIGHFTIRFENMRTGYRHIKLINPELKGTLFVGIKILPYESIHDIKQ